MGSWDSWQPELVPPLLRPAVAAAAATAVTVTGMPAVAAAATAVVAVAVSGVPAVAATGVPLQPPQPLPKTYILGQLSSSLYTSHHHEPAAVAAAVTGSAGSILDLVEPPPPAPADDPAFGQRLWHEVVATPHFDLETQQQVGTGYHS